MPVHIVRFTTTEDHVAEIDAAATTLLDALTDARPPGVGYAVARLADGISYVAVLRLDDGVENPLPGLPAGVAFQKVMHRCALEAPTPEPVTVIGTHGLLA